MLKAIGHRLLIKPKDIEETTKSGILIYSSERQKKLEEFAIELGTVVDIGPTAWKHESFGGERWAEVGDTVIFAKYGGRFVTDPDSDNNYIVIDDEDILVKVE